MVVNEKLEAVGNREEKVEGWRSGVGKVLRERGTIDEVLSHKVEDHGA